MLFGYFFPFSICSIPLKGLFGCPSWMDEMEKEENCSTFTQLALWITFPLLRKRNWDGGIGEKNLWKNDDNLPLLFFKKKSIEGKSEWKLTFRGSFSNPLNRKFYRTQSIEFASIPSLFYSLSVRSPAFVRVLDRLPFGCSSTPSTPPFSLSLSLSSLSTHPVPSFPMPLRWFSKLIGNGKRMAFR